MENNGFSLEMKFIEKCVDTRSRDYKIFLCNENLYNSLSKMKFISKSPVKFIKNMEFFKNYKKEFMGKIYQSNTKLDDPNFYLINTEKIENMEDKRDFVVKVQSWYYYGEDRFDTRAYLAMLKKDFELETFNNGLKLSQIVIDMGNHWNLEMRLKELI